MKTKTNSRSGPFRLEGEMTIYTASELKPKLMQEIVQHHDLEIDLSQVSEIDTSGLQLLIMAKKECIARSGSLRLTGHSQAVREVLDMCNMSQFFGDPVIMPAQER